MSPVPAKKRLMYVVTEDWYFMSHRLPLARAARDAGYEVLVATRLTDQAAMMAQEGFAVVGLRKMRRGGRNPLGELAAVGELVSLYKCHRPDVVHHIAMKPVLYGSIAALVVGIRAVVNNLAGLGYVFSSVTSKAVLLRPFIKAFLSLVLKRQGSVTIVQNSDDAKLLVDQLGVTAASVHLIKGSGVDMSKFVPAREEAIPPIVMLASRMIWDKGIRDFVKAAALLRGEGVNARFIIVGSPDVGNPDAIPETILQGYNKEGVVEWWGHRDDIPRIISYAALVCLPTTYGEGVPKILIEAAAGSCAIVAYDVAGCREIVRDGENGLLVRAGDISGLAIAIRGLLEDRTTRTAMGLRGRERVEREFTQERVIAQTLDVYGSMALK